MMQEVALWEWILRGIDGAVKVLEQMAKDGAAPTQTHHDKLADISRRMDALAAGWAPEQTHPDSEA